MSLTAWMEMGWWALRWLVFFGLLLSPEEYWMNATRIAVAMLLMDLHWHNDKAKE